MEECVINCGGPSDHSTTSFSFATATTRTTPFTDQSSTILSDRTLRLTTEASLSLNKNRSSPVLATKKPAEISCKSIVFQQFINFFCSILITFYQVRNKSLLTVRMDTKHDMSFDIYFSSNYFASVTSITLPSISPCGLPSQVGSCNSFRDRYYFDMANQMCKKFR